MNIRIAGPALCAMLFAICSAVQAQQPRNILLVGYLAGSGSPNKAFVQGMRDLGYVEGKDVAFAFRTTEGRSERYADLAAELVLVSLKVDIIIADGTSASLAAKKATSTIPIVMTTSTDPVGNGLVASLARPGGNVTGLSNIGGDLGESIWNFLRRLCPSSAVWQSCLVEPETLRRKASL